MCRERETLMSWVASVLRCQLYFDGIVSQQPDWVAFIILAVILFKNDLILHIFVFCMFRRTCGA